LRSFSVQFLDDPIPSRSDCRSQIVAFVSFIALCSAALVGVVRD
jgi:hypothetical protein